MYKKVVAYTTRGMRESEILNESYHFIEKYNFLEKEKQENQKINDKNDN